MIPPPPVSTLFPYTTLFRSDRLCDQSVQPQRWRHQRRRKAVGGQHPDPVREPVPGRGRDRKSTRLNSSHRCISYAVFCLKKKKKEKKKTIHTNKHNQIIEEM